MTQPDKNILLKVDRGRSGVGERERKGKGGKEGIVGGRMSHGHDYDRLIG